MPIYDNLDQFYRDQGGELAKETIFASPSWDEVADHKRQFAIEVRYNHGNSNVFGVAGDGRVATLGIVIGDDYADAEELLSWFHERDGTWPERSLQELLARVDEVNGRYAFQTLRRSLPLAGPGAICKDCGKRAHRVCWGTPLCDDCLCRRKGGP